MRLIATITDKEVFGQETKPAKEYSVRSAAREIIFNKQNKIALLYSKKLNFHKLPGGGIEENEDIKIALKRELSEEIGCDIEIIKEIGKIIEIKDRYSQKQTSYCFSGKVKNKGNNSFTQEEKDIGMEIKWERVESAIKLLEKDNPDDYTAKFIVHRDLTLLKALNEDI